MNVRSNRQGGSIISFAVIGVVLVGLLALGLYTVKMKVDQSRSDSLATRDETPKEQPTVLPGDDTGEKHKDTVPAANTDDTKKEDNGGSSTPGGSQSQSSDAANSGTQALPQTGPADTLMRLIAVGALTFAGVTYARSRSQISTL